jgi:excisionase family DNA binding protein
MERKFLPPAAGPQLGFSIKEAVFASGLGRDMIYAAIRDGQLKARKVGRRTLILRADLEAYLHDLPELQLRSGESRMGPS